MILKFQSVCNIHYQYMCYQKLNGLRTKLYAPRNRNYLAGRLRQVCQRDGVEQGEKMHGFFLSFNQFPLLRGVGVLRFGVQEGS